MIRYGGDSNKVSTIGLRDTKQSAVAASVCNGPRRFALLVRILMENPEAP